MRRAEPRLIVLAFIHNQLRRGLAGYLNSHRAVDCQQSERVRNRILNRSEARIGIGHDEGRVVDSQGALVLSAAEIGVDAIEPRGAEGVAGERGRERNAAQLRVNCNVKGALAIRLIGPASIRAG